MLPVGFEHTFSAGERPLRPAFDLIIRLKITGLCNRQYSVCVQQSNLYVDEISRKLFYDREKQLLSNLLATN